MLGDQRCIAWFFMVCLFFVYCFMEELFVLNKKNLSIIVQTTCIMNCFISETLIHQFPIKRTYRVSFLL